MKPYYTDDSVTLYLGDCLEVTAWHEADVLVTDPPYGIGWTRGTNLARASQSHAGIQGDRDTSVRDAALEAWGDRPGVVFGSLYAPAPTGNRQTLIWRKPRDAGVVGSTMGWRRDVEAVYLIGTWPHRTSRWSSIVASRATNSGNPSSPAGRTGHPHAKPVDLMEELIDRAPPGTIADPFAGSGSTLVAAKQLGRKAIGVEIDERLLRDCRPPPLPRRPRLRSRVMSEREAMKLQISRKVRPYDPDRRQERAAALRLILQPYVSEKDLNDGHAPAVIVALIRHTDALIDEYVDSAITESLDFEAPS